MSRFINFIVHIRNIHHTLNRKKESIRLYNVNFFFVYSFFGELYLKCFPPFFYLNFKYRIHNVEKNCLFVYFFFGVVVAVKFGRLISMCRMIIQNYMYTHWLRLIRVPMRARVIFFRVFVHGFWLELKMRKHTLRKQLSSFRYICLKHVVQTINVILSDIPCRFTLPRTFLVSCRIRDYTHLSPPPLCHYYALTEITGIE